MRQAVDVLTFQTRGRGLVEITGEVRAWTARQGVRTGLLTLFCRHTSASLLIQENAAPDVRTDLEAFFERIAPEEPGRYVRTSGSAFSWISKDAEVWRQKTVSSPVAIC